MAGSHVLSVASDISQVRLVPLFQFPLLEFPNFSTREITIRKVLQEMTFENPVLLTSDAGSTESRGSKRDYPLIDARGPRFGAAITVIVLALALVFNQPLLVLFQAIVFAIGATFGPQKTPYAFLYRTLIKPRLSGDVPTEDVRPPQFAQAVGLIFALFALLGWAAGIDLAFTVAVGMALAAAFLNAAFDYCLGCEMYLLLTRAFKR